MQQKEAAPITTVTTSANAVRPGTWAPSAAHPMPSSTAAMTIAMTTAVSTRPAMTAAAGTGVARRRFSTPRSRCAVTEARRDNPECDDAGHVVHRRADLAARDLGGAPAAAEHRREDHQEYHGQGQGEELRLAVAEKGAQVVAGLVQGHPDHWWSFVLVGPVRER